MSSGMSMLWLQRTSLTPMIGRECTVLRRIHHLQNRIQKICMPSTANVSCTFVSQDKLYPEEGIIQRRDWLISVQLGESLHVHPVVGLIQDFLYGLQEAVVFIHCINGIDNNCEDMAMQRQCRLNQRLRCSAVQTQKACLVIGDVDSGTSSMVRDNDVGPLVNDWDEEESGAQDRHQEEGPKKHSIQDLGYKFPILNHLRIESNAACSWVVTVHVAAHAQQLRQSMQEDPPHPGCHAVMGRRGAMVDVDGKDGDDDGERDEDHSEDQVLPDERDGLRRRRNDLLNDQEENCERHQN
ncbi:hypothetical protein FQN60_011363 [Etheostoma spectabile]|uniref:Uncharacterized protein n=1 Tax=Etheostoma spectabile TaxID=54343 RepID=A0A5J5DRZ6_9PERO|nr:hypothetical protein FQN60_011363 [Etheostoma spectabile]